MVREILDEKAFFEKYRGQRYRRISTPADYPYIYLFLEEGRGAYDNLDVNGDGSNSRVYFTSEGEGDDVRGNKAILEHTKRKGVYNSLLLFGIENNVVRYIGEYFLAGVHRNQDTKKIDYFELEKVPQDLDNVQIFYVEKKMDEIHVLSEIRDRDDYFGGKDKEKIRNQVVQLEDTRIEEGNYVDVNYQIIPEREVTNVDANPEEKKVAQHKKIIEICNQSIRKNMRVYRKEKEKSEHALNERREIMNVQEVILFCVNVGCGLTNFLVLVKEDPTFNELWCFDWGIDNRRDAEYVNNIEECLDYIKQQYYVDQQIKITKFFLSHPHADHYSEVQPEYLDDSEIWINPYIHDSGIGYQNLLSELLKRTGKFVEPVSANATGNIVVCHPDKSIEYKFLGARRPDRYYTSKPNNVSPLIKINIKNKSIFLTGDIEHQGWTWYKNAGGGEMSGITVLLHSHHGSNTGFRTNIPNAGDTEYETLSSRIDVLSSRNGAYSGIISPDMLAHPSYANTWKTESTTPIKYLKINLLTEVVEEVR